MKVPPALLIIIGKIRMNSKVLDKIKKLRDEHIYIYLPTLEDGPLSTCLVHFIFPDDRYEIKFEIPEQTFLESIDAVDQVIEQLRDQYALECMKRTRDTGSKG